MDSTHHPTSTPRNEKELSLNDETPPDAENYKESKLGRWLAFWSKGNAKYSKVVNDLIKNIFNFLKLENSANVTLENVQGLSKVLHILMTEHHTKEEKSNFLKQLKSIDEEDYQKIRRRRAREKERKQEQGDQQHEATDVVQKDSQQDFVDTHDSATPPSSSQGPSPRKRRRVTEVRAHSLEPTQSSSSKLYHRKKISITIYTRLTEGQKIAYEIMRVAGRKKTNGKRPSAFVISHALGVAGTSVTALSNLLTACEL